MHEAARLLLFLVALAGAASAGRACCGTADVCAQASVHALLAFEGALDCCMRDMMDVHPAHAQVVVPELELEVSTGTLGGLVTTVEGLVRAVETALKNTQVRCDLPFVHTPQAQAWCMRFLLHPPSALQVKGVMVDEVH